MSFCLIRLKDFYRIKNKGKYNIFRRCNWQFTNFQSHLVVDNRAKAYNETISEVNVDIFYERLVRNNLSRFL